MIYRIVVSIIIIAIFFLLIKKTDLKFLVKSMFQKIASFKLLFQSGKDSKAKVDFNLSRIVFLNLSILFFVLLALTSFIPVLLGYSLTGFILILHITIAPFFVFVLTLTAIFWAEKMKLDFTSIRSNSFILKLCFWLFLIFSLPAILSIIFGMYPLFGMESQHILLEVHKYSVLLLFIVLSLFIITKYKVVDTSTEEK